MHNEFEYNRVMMESEMEKRLQKVTLVAMDVDGVLTDGRIVFGTQGMEFKFFNVRDGHGIVLLHRAGIRTVFITGRQSELVERRAKELGVSMVYQDIRDKLDTYNHLKTTTDTPDDCIAYIGDDLVDLPIMSRVGVAVAVADAHPEVKRVAHFVTEACGGKGAVREFIERLLISQGKWKEVTGRYRL